MTTATQSDVRAWARAQGMKVNARGSLPARVVAAYASAHPSSRGTSVTTPRKGAAKKAAAKKTTAKKATARKATTRKATARKTTARKSTARRGGRAAAARTSAAPAQTSRASAPPAGSIDLAGGLRSYLGSIDTEVRAVSALSERIDALVTELNAARDEQAKRLIVLDELRASVSDGSLGSFLDQAIRPRKTRVVEVVPKRLK